VESLWRSGMAPPVGRLLGTVGSGRLDRLKWRLDDRLRWGLRWPNSECLRTIIWLRCQRAARLRTAGGLRCCGSICFPSDARSQLCVARPNWPAAWMRVDPVARHGRDGLWLKFAGLPTGATLTIGCAAAVFAGRRLCTSFRASACPGCAASACCCFAKGTGGGGGVFLGDDLPACNCRRRRSHVTRGCSLRAKHALARWSYRNPSADRRRCDLLSAHSNPRLRYRLCTRERVLRNHHHRTCTVRFTYVTFVMLVVL